LLIFCKISDRTANPGNRGKTIWGWLGLLIVPAVILGAIRVLIYFKKQRENKRAHALIDATLDATRQHGQSKESSHLAVENALLRELAETQRTQLQVLKEEVEATGRDIQKLQVLLQRSQDQRA
jgi:hypothetical protein